MAAQRRLTDADRRDAGATRKTGETLVLHAGGFACSTGLWPVSGDRRDAGATRGQTRRGCR
ncbi:MAG TPA: hypothetical protein VH540_26170 [Ktedonobacterales bacterium]